MRRHLARQLEDGVRGPEAIDGALIEQAIADVCRGGTQWRGLGPTRDGRHLQPGQLGGREMIRVGTALPRSRGPRMHGDDAIVQEDRHGRVGGSHPQSVSPIRRCGAE
jgi:hypothetical protein